MTIVFAALLYAYCGINSGLNPACPVTQLGIDVSNSTLNQTATLRDDTLFASVSPHGNQQWTALLPLYEHLSITGTGSAYGTGDFDFGYEQVFAHKRLAQIAGLSAEFATGATAFTSGRTQLTPSYALSYAVGDRISLVAIGEYTFGVGGTKLPFAPRTQTLTVVPRAIIDLTRSGLYAAADIQGSNVTGDQRYQAYKADAAFGIVHDYGQFSLTYGVPIARFTRDNVFYHTLAFQYTWRP